MTPATQRKSKPPGRPFTKASLRQAWKETERIVKGIDVWLAPRLASKFANKHRDTLALWAETCPWKPNGEPLITRTFPSTNGRTIKYYLEADLDEVLTAIAKRPRAPTAKGMVEVGEAVEQLGVSHDTVRRRFKRFKPGAKHEKLPGKRSCKTRDKKKGSWATSRAYLPKDFVDHYDALQNGSQIGDDTMDAKEIAAALQIPVSGVHSLVRRGKLPADKQEQPTISGHLRQLLRVPRESVEQLKRDRAARQEVKPEPYFDDDGAWLPGIFAVRKYRKFPHINDTTLRRYAGKPCPCMNGEVLRGKPIKWPNGYGTPSRPNPMGFLEEDLRKIAGLMPSDKPPPERRPIEGASQQTVERQSTRGRAHSSEALEVQKHCHERRALGIKRTTVRHEAVNIFGAARAPKSDCEVTIYAGRYEKWLTLQKAKSSKPQ